MTDIEHNFKKVLKTLIPSVGSVVLILTALNIILTVKQGLKERPILMIYMNHLCIDILIVASNGALLAHIYAGASEIWFDNLMIASFYSSIMVFAVFAIIRFIIFTFGQPQYPQKMIKVAISVSWVVTIIFVVVRNYFKIPNYDTRPYISALHSCIVIFVGLGTLVINLYIMIRLKYFERQINRQSVRSQTERTSDNATESSSELPDEAPETRLLLNIQQQNSANKTAIMLFSNNFISSLYFIALNIYLLGLYSTGGSCKAPDDKTASPLYFFVCTISGPHKLEHIFLLLQSLGNNLVILLQRNSRQMIGWWWLRARIKLGIAEETSTTEYLHE